MKGKVIVGRRWDKGAEYIGRGSPLGNPFPMRDKSDRERNRVCDEFEVYLDKKITEGDPRIIGELERLAKLALRPEGVTIGCFCAPQRCHGDTVRERIGKILEKWGHELEPQSPKSPRRGKQPELGL